MPEKPQDQAEPKAQKAVKRFKADGLCANFKYTDKARGILVALRNEERFPTVKCAWIAGNHVYVLKDEFGDWDYIKPALEPLLKAA